MGFFLVPLVDFSLICLSSKVQGLTLNFKPLNSSVLASETDQIDETGLYATRSKSLKSVLNSGPRSDSESLVSIIVF